MFPVKAPLNQMPQVFYIKKTTLNCVLILINYSIDSEEHQLFNLWRDHEKCIQQSTGHGGRLKDPGFATELNLYLKTGLARLSDDPLQVWKDMPNVYPIISKIALKYCQSQVRGSFQMLD